MFNIEEELKKLPKQPGVYIMKDKDDKILYVGKAIVLRNRVKQYFQKTNKSQRIEKMVSLIDHFEYIVTDNEAEALILECNLIKKNRPKFNVLLKDDKTYPYIKIDIKSDYPSVFMTRKLLNDGSKYFGPYPSITAAKEMISFIKERFQIRQCKNFKGRTRECLNFHIKKCLGPCVNKISKEEYNEQIKQIIMLLEGKTSQVIKQLEEEMKFLSDKKEYEKAAILRDKKLAIERISEKQRVANINEKSIDVLGVAENELTICLEILFIRNSKMIGREHYFFDTTSNKEEIISGFIKQYYLDKIDVPGKIILEYEFEDKELLEKVFLDKYNKKVEIKVPKKGEKLRFIDMAKNNAKITLENRCKEQENILNNIKETLKLEVLPKKIESYDISNLAGEYIVAGMCTAIDGKIKRNLNKRFKIKTVFGQDDSKCTEEVVTRRLSHSIENSKGAFGELPNLILADGGIIQIRAIKKALDKYNLNIPVFGMVKDDKHRTKVLIDDEKNEITINEQLMNFITNMQDEVHKVAIEYNRKLKQKEITKSKLDEIKGIGPEKKKELLIKFGSIEGIKLAKIEELTKIKGISENLARKIKKELD